MAENFYQKYFLEGYGENVKRKQQEEALRRQLLMSQLLQQQSQTPMESDQVNQVISQIMPEQEPIYPSGLKFGTKRPPEKPYIYDKGKFLAAPEGATSINVVGQGGGSDSPAISVAKAQLNDNAKRISAYREAGQEPPESLITQTMRLADTLKIPYYNRPKETIDKPWYKGGDDEIPAEFMLFAQGDESSPAPTSAAPVVTDTATQQATLILNRLGRDSSPESAKKLASNKKLMERLKAELKAK